jgi:TonB family protein
MTERELEERRRPGVGQWVVASLLLHLVVVGGLYLLPLAKWADQLMGNRPAEPPIEFEIIDDKGLLPPSLLGDVEPPPASEAKKDEPKKTEEEKKQDDEREPKGQVVELAPPKVEQRPDKADFVSEYNTKVDKQTRARKRGPRAGAVAGAEAQHQPEKKSVAPPAPPSPAKPEKPGAETAEQPKKPATGGKSDKPDKAERAEKIDKPRKAQKSELLAMRTEVRRGSEAEAEVGLNPVGEHGGKGEASRKDDGQHKGAESRTSPEQGLQGQPAAPGRDGSVLPSFSTSSKAVGGGPDDYLRNVDEGDETALNSKQWVYASFFNRVKRQVAQKWHPAAVYRRYDPNGQVFGGRDRFTVVRVLLNRDGSLRNVALEKRSGVEFLDEEALSALRQASPFVNPPGGLVDKQSGLISFRFGFFFEINSSSKIKLFRY